MAALAADLAAAIDAALAVPPVPEPLAALAERVLPLSRKDLTERERRLERLRRQGVRLERESRAIREQGARLLQRSRDLRARTGRTGDHSAEALLALSRLRADHNQRVIEWANRVAQYRRRRSSRDAGR